MLPAERPKKDLGRLAHGGAAPHNPGGAACNRSAGRRSSEWSRKAPSRNTSPGTGRAGLPPAGRRGRARAVPGQRPALAARSSPRTRPITSWGDTLGDPTVAAALLDRLLHPLLRS